MDINNLNEQAILHCEKNIEKYNPTNIQSLDIPVWLISTIMLRNTESNFLTRKFVSNYGKLFENFMLKDILIKDIRTEILSYFDIKDDSNITFIHETFNRKPVTFIKIHVDKYLELAVLVPDEKRFQLVNQDLHEGYITIDKQSFVYLMRLVLESKLFHKIKTMKKYEGNELINNIVVNKLSNLYPKSIKRVHHSSTESGSQPTNIKLLIEKAYKEHHLTHNERIKVGIYLQAQGYDEDYIIDVFRQCSDFNEKTTRYQLKSLQRYIK